MGKIPMSELIPRSEIQHKTVLEYAPDSEIADMFRELALAIFDNDDRRIPKPLSDAELDGINEEIEGLLKEKEIGKV